MDLLAGSMLQYQFLCECVTTLFLTELSGVWRWSSDPPHQIPTQLGLGPHIIMAANIHISSMEIDDGNCDFLGIFLITCK